MENLQYKLAAFLSLLLLALAGHLHAQDQGSFFIRNYAPKEYRKQTKAGSPENHAIMQDERGVIYIANNAGLLEYDGTNWKLLPYDANHDIRSLEKTTDGTIAVAGRNELGMFVLNNQGEYEYKSLEDQLEPDSVNQITFWYTYKHNNDIYFASFYPSPLRIYRFKDGKLQLERRIEEGKNSRFYVINGEIYGHLGEKGFNHLVDEEWRKFEGTDTDEWKELLIYKVVQLSDNRLLLGTFQGDIFILDLTHERPLQVWNNEASRYCTENQILNIETLSDGSILFGTVKGGAFIANLQGQITKRINKNNDLQDNIVFDALEDRQGGIWLALFDGVSRIQINSPLNFWGEDLGLEGRAVAATRYKGILFVNTVLGVHYLKDGQFHKIPNSPLETGHHFHFFPDGDSTQEKLLTSSFDGIYEVIVEGNNPPSLQKIDYSPSRTYYAAVSPKNPNRIYLGGMMGGNQVLDYENGKWSKTKSIRGATGRRLGGVINEDRDGNLWVMSYSSRPEESEITRIQVDDSLNITKMTVYDTAGYHLPTFGWQLIQNDTLFAFSDEGLYFYDKALDNFQVYQGFEGIFTKGLASPNIHYFDQETGNLWLDLTDSEGNPTGKIAMYHKEIDGSYSMDSTSLVRLSEENVGPWLHIEGAISWLPTSNGIYRFDSKLAKKKPIPYQAIIRTITVGTDSVLFNGNHFITEDATTHISLSQVHTPEIDYCYNTLKVEFSALFFEKSEELEFSYLLEGLDQATWSKWTTDTKVSFNNLREGAYSFKLKARNIYGKESVVASYDFEVLPPWQRTTLAYTGYASLLIFFIWAVVRLNGIRLKKHNEMLTQLVKERTHEIHSKNEELRTQQEEILSQSENLRQANEEVLATNEHLKEQKEEVEQTNEMLNEQKAELQKAYNHITDSVRYAQRIQRAILGEAESIVTGFKDGFIYFKPRDIVSGDFYWYAEVNNKKIVIAADCTGHGVPGAFMTVMGNSMLHQIINEGQVTCPSKILTELDKRITRATGANDMKRAIHDGMDVAVAVFDDVAGTLHFAGAKNPLIAIQKGELTVLKGSKFPIGSAQFKQEKVFEVHSIPFEKGDQFYLFSDGFQDQFGGEQDTKYLKKRFRGFLYSHSQLPMHEQKDKLDSEFKHWKGQKAQTDDILVIGLQV